MRFNRKDNSERLRREFLPEALELIEKPASPLGHFMIWLIIIIFSSLVLLLVFGRLNEYINAKGRIITIDPIQKVQSVNGGILTEICFKEGEFVEAGDILFRIDDSLEDNKLNYNSEYYYELQYKIQLLNDLLEEKEIELDEVYLNYQSTFELICSIQKSEKEEVLGAELQIANAQMQYNLQKNTLDLLKIQKNNAINNINNVQSLNSLKSVEESKLEDLNTDLKDLVIEVNSYKSLYESDAISKDDYDKKVKELKKLKQDIKNQNLVISTEKIKRANTLSEIESTRDVITQQIVIQESQLIIADNNIKIAKASLDAVKASYKEKYFSMISQYSLETKQLDVAIKENTIASKEKVITAQCSGIIRLSYVGNVGEVLSPSQLLAEIIPEENQFIIEAFVSTKDIAFIKIDQDAFIKLDTYNYQEYGKWKGKVVYISPDAIQDQKGGFSYKVKIKLDNNRNFGVGQLELEIIAGMTGNIEIEIGDKKLYQYFLGPLFDHFDGSLNER